MTLSDISIRRPVLAWMLMSGLIIFGAISLGRLGVSQLPDIDFPVLTVSAEYPGAAPEVVETEIADKIEQAVISVEGLRDVTSSIRQGRASVQLEFDLERDIDAALQEVQANIARIRFPEDVDPPTITKTNPEDQPIVWIGVMGKRSLRDTIVYADLHLRDQFQILPGVGEVILGGFQNRALRIWADENKLRMYELTILDLLNCIEREHVELAAGYLDNPEKEFNVRAMGEGLTAKQVGEIIINQRGGQPIFDSGIRIKDVARVEDGLEDVRRISRISGIEGIGLGFKKQRGANAVDVADRIKAKMAELNKTLPEDIRLQVNFDATTFIKESIDETMFTLVLSGLVTAMVVWLFLGGLRRPWLILLALAGGGAGTFAALGLAGFDYSLSNILAALTIALCAGLLVDRAAATFNVLLAIPTSIIGTFIIIYFLGFTLNMFTLLALALAIGIVVDDAIMVLENIVRHSQMGKNRIQAAKDGSREIFFAVIATTAAVIAVFLPVVFVKGAIGYFLFQFGITLCAAVALSSVEALTLTPMRCAQFMEDHAKVGRLAVWRDAFLERLASLYRSVLAFFLRWRWITLLGSLGLFAASLLLARLVPFELIPAQDQSMFLVRLKTPIGSSLSFTSEKFREAEKLVEEKYPEIIKRFVAIGGFGGGEVDTGIMFLTLKPMHERTRGQVEIMNSLRNDLNKIPDVQAFSQDLSLRGFTAKRGFPIEFTITGRDWSVLDEKAREIMNRLREEGLAVDIDSDYRTGMPEVRIVPKREAASERGVIVNDIVRTINAGIGGVRQNQFSSDGRRYDVRLRLEPTFRTEPEHVQALQVRNMYGELAEMKDVTSLEVVPTVQTLARQNRERSVTISANPAPGIAQDKALAEAERIANETLPDGYKFHLSGGAAAFKEAFSGLGIILILGVVVAYMVLASQFNSFIHPFTVMLPLPFAVSGAFVALYLGGLTFNLYSFIGLVLLMGIAKKNSIMLVEFTNQRRYQDKRPVTEALLDAAKVRLRPILMTTAATLAAALPPALAIGPGAESRIPMAIVILGGVLISTCFTLIIVPCLYSILSGLEHSQRYQEEVERVYGEPPHEAPPADQPVPPSPIPAR